MDNGRLPSVPKLRMLPPETAEELAHRLEREERAAQVQKESRLERSLAPFRVGSVRYLNAVPLTRGLEEEVTFATPSELAGMLQRDELDAALVSVTEPLMHDRYDVLDSIAIASLGEVQSVFLAHRKPLKQITEVYCDPASLTSVNLLRVLLAEETSFPNSTHSPATISARSPITPCSSVTRRSSFCVHLVNTRSWTWAPPGSSSRNFLSCMRFGLSGADWIPPRYDRRSGRRGISVSIPSRQSFANGTTLITTSARIT
jgi:hypothetical protein